MSRRRLVTTRWLPAGLLTAMALALAAPGGLHAQAAGPPLEILHGFTLVDGLGGLPVPDAALAVRGTRIVDAGPRARVLRDAPRGSDPILVDLGGGWVVPGLIDAHVHLATSPDREAAAGELRRLLRWGITAVRDMAGDARLLASLALEARTGRTEGADVHHSALVAGPTFFEDPRSRTASEGWAPGRAPWMQALEADTDMVVAVARARGTSATGLKIYADLDAGTLAAVTDEAHRQGMPVWAHAMVYPARPLEVVRAGVDVISHACPLAWEAMADAPDRYHHDDVPGFALIRADTPVLDSLLTEMARRGTVLDATLAMHTLVEGGPAPGTVVGRGGPPASRRPPPCSREFARAVVRRAHELGVPIAAGTDFTTPPEAPPALFLELEALVDHAGLTPLEAIGAATRVGAQTLGAEDRIGTLQPGAELTFVLLSEDPTADIGNLRAVREVWKNAVRYQAPEAPGGD